ncbi:FAD-binding and (Fe-S)-binding domain-containing protein [Frondihabitans australicus]|uniref:FAD/FMN-containing dehydrogenase n=1 Tax=Frondihabitans australicus TaxID=386892 RepID=A0A495IN67_9MICO|nr:FAD-binding and (Fe-S)-binding domain-containing protein [Frondihabitans australicus]RKR76565.1 FAD/FMN-containing dehydrogenase [Frondihabitans australicus]
MRPAWVDALAARLHGELDDAPRRLAEYSSDASNYRVVPLAVVFPRDEHDVVACVEAARAAGSSVTARGAGTSIAGNAIGPGLVLDFSRHFTGIVRIDGDSRTATVRPGVVLADLQRAAAAHGLRFGPDPSTASRCTLGGMIGNNACGPRAVQWGTTAANVRALRFVDGTGEVRTVESGRGFDGFPDLEPFITRHLGMVRTEFGRFGRQISGFSLEHLLPERGRDLAKALVGTEGTCGIVLEATVDLVPLPAATSLVVLAYEDAARAADDVMSLLPLKPLAIESMDSALVDVVRAAQGATRVPDLPSGGAWLFVETQGSDEASADEAATAIAAAAAGARASRVVGRGDDARRLWRIREDGVGLAGRTLDGRPAWPGWEDSAVPPENLGAYLRDLAALKRRLGVSGLEYGHFGDGCVHTRLDFPFDEGPRRFREFLAEAAPLVVSHGGSLSGEHGDGRARGELLPTMYSPEAIHAFAEFTRIFDPDGVLNPGIGVDPAPVDADLRVPASRILPVRGLSLPRDHGDLSEAVHRCVGVGACRADSSATGGFMCPSFLATRDEKDSTRGRARVLQEMIDGGLDGRAFDSPEVADSLDLCLSCRACASDCPAGVDMASYKSEVLYRRYGRRIRPVAHYTFGRLPQWLALTSLPAVATTVNALARVRPLVRLGLRLAGADARREVPRLPRRTFRRWWAKRSGPARPSGRGPVLLFTDTFTNGLTPSAGIAAVRVLEDAGYEVAVLPRQECCGLTWITTGQLDQAKRLLRSTVDALAPYVERGVPIVGLEPSCMAVLRSDAEELLPGDERARAVASGVWTLAELLRRTPGWEPPRLDGEEAVVQPHCHQHAVMGFEADAALLESAGVDAAQVAGCCGLAGNFGMERGHYDVSVAIAENGLLPALAARPGAVLLADGFSCRTQASQLAGRDGIHLAELLASRLPSGD